MKDDESSILNNFLTPGYVNKVSQRSTSNGRRRSVHKRVPIFSYTNNPKKNYFIFDHNLSNYEDRSLIDRKVINYDFCGCQSQMTPCNIIMNTFLRKVKGEFLRQSYEQEFQRKEGKTNLRQSRYKRSLLSQLPNWYPQLLYAQLKNLIQVVGVQEINYTQFLCLAAIEYHCKVQYLTYYLYEDLKKSYCEKERFKKDIERELHKLGTNLSQIKMMYSQSIGISEQLVEFVNDYYDSVGANLVPIQYYAKFMVAIYKHGNRLFVRLLTNFIVYRKEEMKRGLKFLKLNETEVFRNYMRELNFQDFIKQAQ